MTETRLTTMQQAITRKGVFWLVLLASLVADIATKAWADNVVRPTEPKVTPIIEGLFGWKWAENQGAAFSILDGRPIVLALIASCVLIALLLYMYKADHKRWFFLVALGLVGAGAIGNLYDRLLLGHVRDFMFFIFDLPGYGSDIGIGSFKWKIPRKYPVFNVADIEIIAGVLMLVLISFKADPKKKKKKQDDKAEDADGS